MVPGRYAGVVAGSWRSGELPLAVVTVPSGYLAGGRSGVFVDEGGFRHLGALDGVEGRQGSLLGPPGYQGLVMDFNVPDPTPDSCGDEPFHWVDEMGGSQGAGPARMSGSGSSPPE